MKTRHIISFIIVLIFSLILIGTFSYAESSMKLTLIPNKESINENEKVSVKVYISQFAGLGEGTNAYAFILKYDSDKLEFEQAKGQNNWNSPSYNVSEGRLKFSATRTTFFNKDGDILEITFKAKESITLQASDISLEAISFAIKKDNKISKLVIENTELSISNKEEQTDNDETNIVFDNTNRNE